MKQAISSNNVQICSASGRAEAFS